MSIYVCLRVLVCSVIVEARRLVTRVRDAANRRQHCRAIIEDLACSGFNLHLAAYVVGLSVGMMVVRAVLYCCAVLCCAVLCCAAAAVRVACACFHRGYQKRCFMFYCQKVLQRTNNKKCTWSKKCPSADFGKSHTSVCYTSKIKPYRVYVKTR